MTTWMAVLVTPTVPAAPPLVDSTVLVAIITSVTAILLLIVGARVNRKETTPSPPAAAAEGTIGEHDLKVAERLGAIDSKLRRDFERLERGEITDRDHEERLRAIEHKLGITPDPGRLTAGGNQ